MVKASKRFTGSCFPVKNKRRNVALHFLPLFAAVALIWVIPATIKKDAREAFEYVQTPFNLVAAQLERLENFLKTRLASKGKLIAICEDLVRENLFLRLELSVLRAKPVDAIGGEASMIENFSLKPAKVIRRDVVTWSDELVINVGSDDGIRNGMGVISKNCVIGRIRSAKAKTSVVELITSPRFKMVVNAVGDEEMNPIIFSGNGQGLVSEAIGVATNIPFDFLQNGEKITLVTSHLCGIFPQNITVGTVVFHGIKAKKQFSSKVILDGELLSKVREVSVLVNVEAGG
jgi:rod shape-determining protein MreC